MAAQLRAASRLGLLLLWRARAQIYDLKDVGMPMGKPYSLEVLYTYYVFKHDDSPLQAPEMPYVKMNGLKTSVTLPAGTSVEGCSLDKSFSGVQLSLVPRRQFWSLIDPQSFCDVDSRRLLLRKDKVDQDVWPGVSFDISGEQKEGDKTELPNTGAYYLVLSNCGTCLNLTVSGSVELRNTHGYVPANEYYKMPFYGALTMGFTVVAVAWVVHLARWNNQVHSIHYCMAVVLVCALVESLMWRVLLTSWNDAGSFAPWVMCAANLSSVLKSGLCYVLVCYMAQGWGVTQESLESVTKTKVELFAIVYFPMQYSFEGVLTFRHTHRISSYFMFACWLPCAALNFTVFYWIFSALIEVLESARRSQQPDLLVTLRQLGKTLTFMAVMMLVTLVFKILDISPNEPPASWHGQWILAEGVSDLLFLVVLIAMMWIMAPFRNMKEYLYTATVALDEMEADTIGFTAPGVWAEEDGVGILDDEEQEEGEGFRTMTHPDKKSSRRGDDDDDDRDKGSRAPKSGVADRDLLG